MYSLGLIAGLLLMAGVVAFIGDRVGRRVGRRKLTLLGLRPRHTSIVVTVLTGVLIAGGSLGILAAASNHVRVALFRMDEIQRTLAENRHQLAEMQDQIDAQQRALADVARARDTAITERDRATEQRIGAERHLEQAQAQLTQVQKELDSARAQLAEAEAGLARARKDLEFQVSRVEQLQQLGEVLTERVQDLQAQVTSLERTESELSDAIITLWNTAQRLQYGSVAFRRDEIVLSSVLSVDGGAEQARSKLLEFLRQVQAAVTARMASAGVQGGDEGLVRIRPDEFDADVKILASGKGTWVVRAVVDHNTVAGEAVIVRVELIPRSLAFRKGQVVADNLVDPAKGRIEDQVLDLLRRANEVAITYGGMVTGPDGTVGKLVGAEEFVRVVDHLRRKDRAARVLALADADTYNTEGPLRIRLQVEGEGGREAGVEPGRPAAGVQ